MKPHRANTSRIRIIGGQWGSRLIEVPDATGLRPTPDSVRETVFNWLGQTMDGQSCLDLFAGSGAMGLEAASRGAKQVTLVENAPHVVAHLKKAAEKLEAENIQIIREDALAWLQRNTQRFDVVFLDPPYHQGWIERLAPYLEKTLTENGYVYVEAEHSLTQLSATNPLKCIKSAKSGQVHYHLFSF